MQPRTLGPFSSPRIPGTVIAISTGSHNPTTLPRGIHYLAGLMAIGTAQRVGVIYFEPQPKSVGRTQPAESLLAACDRAAGRLMGVNPAKRMIGEPPGVDRFAPRLTDTITERAWYDVLQEARVGRGIIILINPWDALYRDMTITIDETIIFDDTQEVFLYPEGPGEWADLARTVMEAMLGMRVVTDQPEDWFGCDAVFMPPVRKHPK